LLMPFIRQNGKGSACAIGRSYPQPIRRPRL